MRSLLFPILATALLLCRTWAQSSPNDGNTYGGEIHISGTVIASGSQASAVIDDDDLPTLNVVVHNYSGSNRSYIVKASVYDQVTIPNSFWRSELVNQSPSFIVPAFSTGTCASSTWAQNGLRASVPNFGSRTLPDVRHYVILDRGGEIDRAYIQYSVSGQVYAHNPGFGTDSKMEGSTVTIPTVHLYDGIVNSISVRFSILDESGGHGSLVSLRVGGKAYTQGVTIPRLPAQERGYSRLVSERMHGAPLTSTLVELLLDDKVIRTAHTPAVFPTNPYPIDFGLIRLKGTCKACQNGMCTAGTIDAKL